MSINIDSKHHIFEKELALTQVQIKGILTLHQLSLFIWETTLDKMSIPDGSTEPYSPTKRRTD